MYFQGKYLFIKYVTQLRLSSKIKGLIIIL